MSEKAVKLNNKFFISISLILICFFLDRFSKIYIINFFTKNDFSEYYVNSYLNYILVWNKGIAFGLFESDNQFYLLVTFIIFCIILFIIYILIKSKIFTEIVCFSIIAGGAIGNLFDRLYYKSVPDFIDLHYKDFHWFTFNVSDIFITIAIIILVTFDLIKLKKEKNNR